MQKATEKIQTYQSFYILGKFSGYIQLRSFYRRYQGSKLILAGIGIFKGILGEKTKKNEGIFHLKSEYEYYIVRFPW